MLCYVRRLAWSTLNWYLSLAAVFVVGDEHTTFGALAAATDLCRIASGAVAALPHGSASRTERLSWSPHPQSHSHWLLPKCFPAGIVLGGVLLVAMLYFAIADFLYVGRLASYVFLVEVPQNIPQSLSFQPQLHRMTISSVTFRAWFPLPNPQAELRTEN